MVEEEPGQPWERNTYPREVTGMLSHINILWTVQNMTHMYVYKDGFILSVSEGDNIKSNDISTILFKIKPQHNTAIWHICEIFDQIIKDETHTCSTI